VKASDVPPRNASTLTKNLHPNDTGDGHRGERTVPSAKEKRKEWGQKVKEERGERVKEDTSD